MKHNIIVKFADTVDKAEKEALFPEIKALFEKTLEIEGIHKVTLKPNVVDKSNRYDLDIEMDMEPEALPAYDDCIWHKKWKEEYGPLLQAKTIIDFEN